MQSDIYVILIIFISISFNDRLSFFFSAGSLRSCAPLDGVKIYNDNDSLGAISKTNTKTPHENLSTANIFPSALAKKRNSQRERGRRWGGTPIILIIRSRKVCVRIFWWFRPWENVAPGRLHRRLILFFWLLEGQKMVCLLRDPLSAASQRQDRLEGVTLAFIVVALGGSQNYTRVTGCWVKIEKLIPYLKWVNWRRYGFLYF